MRCQKLEASWGHIRSCTMVGYARGRIRSGSGNELSPAVSVWVCCVVSCRVCVVAWTHGLMV